MTSDTSVEALWKALCRNANEQGYLSTNIDNLCMSSGLSRSTVKRAIDALQKQKRVVVGAKEGRQGGLVFKLETGPKLVQETGPKLVQKRALSSAFQETGSAAEPTEPEPVSFDWSVSETGSGRRPVDGDRAKQWKNAISSALREGLRHSSECSEAGHARKGCPYCEYVYNRMGKTL